MKKKIIIGVVIVLVVVAMVAANILKNTGSVSAFSGGKAINVKVVKIQKGKISSSVSASGVIEEIEKAKVYFDTPLKVRKLLVEKNQKVTKGQKLVELDMDELNSELEKSRITKTVQELGIQKIRSADGTKSMAAFEAAAALNENTVKSAETTYNDSQKSYEDSKALYQGNAISKSDLDRAEKGVKDSGTALENAKWNYRSALDNLEEAKKSNTQYASGKDIDLETQEQNLKATILGIDSLEKKIKKIEESTLSPIDGMLVAVDIEEGSFTSNMQPAFSIINTEKLQIRANIKEFDTKSVKVGQSVLIYGDAVDKSEGVKGKVTQISSVAETSKTASGEEKLVEVVISIDKTIPVLKPGLGVTCEITTKEKNDALLASFEMLTEDKDGNKHVFVADEKNNVMNEKQVKLGITSDLNVEIIEGLSEGASVIVDPQPSFKEGSKVKIIKDEKK